MYTDDDNKVLDNNNEDNIQDDLLVEDNKTPNKFNFNK